VLLTAYRRNHRISEVVLLEPKAAREQVITKKEKPAQSNTGQVSFDMFQERLTVVRIAEQRGLARSGR
jgi:hypothetical protein